MKFLKAWKRLLYCGLQCVILAVDSNVYTYSGMLIVAFLNFLSLFVQIPSLCSSFVFMLLTTLEQFRVFYALEISQNILSSQQKSFHELSNFLEPIHVRAPTKQMLRRNTITIVLDVVLQQNLCLLASESQAPMATR